MLVARAAELRAVRQIVFRTLETGVRVAFGLAVALTLAACLEGGDRQFVVLADTGRLEAGMWMEFPGPEPLRTPSDWQEVCFEVLAPAGLSDHPMTILDAGGAPVAVQVEAAASADRLVLDLVSYVGPRTFCLGTGDSLAAQAFDRVRIRSSATVHFRQLEWHSTAKW